MAHMIVFQNLTQTQNQSLMGEQELENEHMKKLLSTLMEGLERQLDFFQDDKDVNKKAKTTTKHSNTKVKTRNLLTNVSYRRYKPEDVEKTNFVIVVFSFSTQNLNPTGLDRKPETPRKRDDLGQLCTAQIHQVY